MRFDTKVILAAISVSLPPLYSHQITVTIEFYYLSFRKYILNKSACKHINPCLSSVISFFLTHINIYQSIKQNFESGTWKHNWSKCYFFWKYLIKRCL